MFIRQSKKRITCFLLILCFTLSFSMLSFSAAYTGAYLTTEYNPVTGVYEPVLKDVNPTGQTYSGSNVIEMNVYNNSPDLEANTFNGSTDINNTFQNLDSTGNKYNGSVDIDLTGTGTMTSTVDTFQNASVNASMSDVTFDNPTFNGTTSLSANNLTLGSVPQMTNLLDYVYAQLYNFSRTYIDFNTSTPYNITVQAPHGNVTIELQPIFQYSLSYNPNTNSFSISSVTYVGTFAGYFFLLADAFSKDFQAIGQFLNGVRSYNLYSFTTDGEYYTFQTVSQNASWREALINRFDVLIKLIEWYCSRFYNWYYPLDNVLPEYWRYYNTDTAQQEGIGLAGLMYNISWYLGQMYVLQSGSDALDTMTDQVEAVSETFQEAEQREQQIMDSISSGIESFNPDLSEIGAFKALGWCSNYLQLVFLRLGTYGTVILVGLLLGVCMQFIGYFRYK